MQSNEKVIIDFRSDTVTRPTAGMKMAMMEAPLGDDVYGEDPTVNALEERVARMFGMQAGMFCASGTMTNQIAIKVLTQPGDEVICDQTAHIYNYEGGGIAFNSLASTRLLEGDRGRVTPLQVQENINDAANVHFPISRLVALENTVNKGGGCYYTLPQIAAIHKVTQANKLSLHLDGARIFNALIASGDTADGYGQYFDTISICFSKGLGAPVGSVLLGSKENIVKARRVRKVMGGGWRQAGMLAAALDYALDNHIGRLQQDHDRAALLANALSKMPYIDEVMPQETNIVIFRLHSGLFVHDLVKYCESNNVKVSPFGKQMIRLVTHLDIDDRMAEQAIKVLSAYKPTTK